LSARGIFARWINFCGITLRGIDLPGVSFLRIGTLCISANRLGSLALGLRSVCAIRGSRGCVCGGPGGGHRCRRRTIRRRARGAIGRICSRTCRVGSLQIKIGHVNNHRLVGKRIARGRLRISWDRFCRAGLQGPQTRQQRQYDQGRNEREFHNWPQRDLRGWERTHRMPRLTPEPSKTPKFRSQSSPPFDARQPHKRCGDPQVHANRYRGAIPVVRFWFIWKNVLCAMVLGLSLLPRLPR